MKGIKNLEIEYKYRPKVSVTQFQKFCESRDPVKTILVSGWDYFYSSKDDPDSFYRHRVNTNENQLTFKRKHDSVNSYIRTEHNINLPLSVSLDKVKDLVDIHGYKPDTVIFKNCFIYNYADHTLVFYIVYDVDMVELGRFIEIEMKEDHSWENKEQALEALNKLDYELSGVGLVGARYSGSLFEMYRSTTIHEKPISNLYVDFDGRMWTQQTRRPVQKHAGFQQGRTPEKSNV